MPLAVGFSLEPRVLRCPQFSRSGAGNQDSDFKFPKAQEGVWAWVLGLASLEIWM